MKLNPAFIAVTWALFCAAPVSADQDYVHTFTGFTFPPKIGKFARIRVTPYNEAHSDIEVDYDNDPYTVHLSVYVYPAHDPLQRHYEQCKAGVVSVHPDAKLLAEQRIKLNKSGVTYSGFSALFSFRDKFVSHTEEALLSQLLVFRRGDYYVLFRISYAADDKSAAEGKITDFIQQFAWPPDGIGSS